MADPNAPAPRGLLNWWQGLILAVCSAIVGVAAAVAVMKGTGGPSVSGPSWAMMLLRLIPHFLLLFGVLADAFTYEGVYWTGTMVGIISIFAAPILDYVGGSFGFMLNRMLAKGGGDEPAAQSSGTYEGCDMMSGAACGAGAPQTLTVTASVLSYYIIDLLTNLGPLDAAGAIVVGLFLFGGQAAALSTSLGEGTGKAVFLGGLYGLIVGGTSFAVISGFAPNYLPSSVIAGNKPGERARGASGVGLSSGDAGQTAAA